MRFSEPLNIVIHLDRRAATPLHAQISRQLRAAIRDGVLAHGDRIPSTRTLAAELGVSRSVALHVYHELYAEGLVEARSGSGNFVHCPQRQPRRSESPGVRPSATPIDLRPLGAGGHGFPAAVWRSAWRRAVHRVPGPASRSPQGDPELRAALAAHLRKQHGLKCGADQIVVTSGRVAALDALCQIGAGPGESVAFQQPGPGDLRRLLAARAVDVMPLPVDAEGVLVPRMCPRVRMAVVRPVQAHPQARLSARRRETLLDWAATEGLTLVELERDPFMASSSPSLPLAASAEHRPTVFLGSFTDILAPALDLGYVVAPPELVPAITRAVCGGRLDPSPVVQRVAATLLGEDHLARYLRRMTTLGQARRRIVRRALATLPPDQLAETGFGGLEATLRLGHLPAREVADRLRAQGVLVETGDAPGPARRPDRIVIGYGHLDEVTLKRGLHQIVRTLTQMGREPSRAPDTGRRRGSA
ncbi:aminotransferase-like domain-containing protein [Actinomadura hibisca]|uniref:aminotransferase-like domain-containing protein n=1 Tax=Actinomadura hibisca TaxID=68565 RepID=UPI0008375853|nr:PLP-dependent aminotransferase family protein [Actinomadura hibisca]